jgi:hypothetical protein
MQDHATSCLLGWAGSSWPGCSGLASSTCGRAARACGRLPAVRLRCARQGALARAGARPAGRCAADAPGVAQAALRVRRVRAHVQRGARAAACPSACDWPLPRAAVRARERWRRARRDRARGAPSRYQVARAFAQHASARDLDGGPVDCRSTKAHRRCGGELATVVSDLDPLRHRRPRRARRCAVERWLGALPDEVRAGIEAISIKPYDGVTTSSPPPRTRSVNGPSAPRRVPVLKRRGQAVSRPRKVKRLPSSPTVLVVIHGVAHLRRPRRKNP